MNFVSRLFFQSDEASVVQNAAESPVDTDPAEATEVRTNMPPAGVSLPCYPLAKGQTHLYMMDAV